MFGYVIPCREKLTDEQWHEYRAAYCGLCHTLQDRYGFMAQFLLNYDFTFLTLLLQKTDDLPNERCRRCLSSPIKGRKAQDQDAAMEAAADISVLMIYWQTRDKLSDERGLHRLAALGTLIGLFPVFRLGRRRNPNLNQKINESLKKLQQMEREHCPSIDRTADQFASVLTAMIPPDLPEEQRRPLEQLLYHLGRWIYLIDAWDDLENDMRHNRYNPIISRFHLSNETEKSAAKKSLLCTLNHSENLAISAFHLGTFGYGAPILENVLCAGLPIVRTSVFSGTWKKAKRYRKQELNQL